MEKTKNRNITTFFFDVGGVLLVDFVDQKLADLAKKYRIDPGLLRQFRKQVRPRADLGLISDAEFWTKALQTGGIDATAEDLQVETYMKEIDGTRAVIKSLKRCGYRLAILSNDSRDMANYKRHMYYLDDLFDVAIFSSEVGVIKPNPKIYHIALSRLNAESQNAVFVDDRVDNIEAANQVGMHTILFQNATQLIKELNDLGVQLDL